MEMGKWIEERDQISASTKAKAAVLATALLDTRVHTGANNRFHKFIAHRTIS